MVALFKYFLFFAFAAFLLFDTAFCTCELTQQLTEVEGETVWQKFQRQWEIRQWDWPEGVDAKQKRQILTEVDKLKEEFEKRKSQGYYPENAEFDIRKARDALADGNEMNNFAGIVICKDGSMIYESKARVELLDFNLREHSRECHSLHDKAKYHRKSASFDFQAFISKTDKSLVKYRFYDVCYDGQEIEVDAYVNGVGHFVL